MMGEAKFTEEMAEDWARRKAETERALRRALREEPLEAYIEGLTTVRECVDCAALIAGGPTRCVRCAKEGPPKEPLFWRVMRRALAPKGEG